MTLTAHFVLNGYFENDFDNYTRGRVIYDLGYPE